jgi:hypothetical protein
VREWIGPALLGDDAFFPVGEGDGILTCQLLQRLAAVLLISISTARFFALVHLSIGYQSMVPDACFARHSHPEVGGPIQGSNQDLHAEEGTSAIWAR